MIEGENDWRVYRYRPGSAHLWATTVGGLWRSMCGRLVLQGAVTTVPITGSARDFCKCKICVQHEIRLSNPASKSRLKRRKIKINHDGAYQ